MKIDAREFNREVLKELEKEIYNSLAQSAPLIVSDLRGRVKYELLNTAEVASMLGGELRGEFGFVAGQETSYVYPVIDYIVNNILYELKDIEFRGGRPVKPLKIRLLNATMEDLNAIPGARYDSQDGEVKWLEWILTKGDRIIIRDHRIQYKFNSTIRSKKVNHPLPVSRSGLAIMVKQTRRGRGWKVPSQYAGTKDRNFITDTFEFVMSRLEQIMINRLI